MPTVRQCAPVVTVARATGAFHAPAHTRLRIAHGLLTSTRPCTRARVPHGLAADFRFAADARWEAGMDDCGVARIDSAKYTRAAKLGSALRMETFEEDGVVSHVARDAASGEELWSAQLVMRGDEDGDCAQLELAAAGKSDFVVRTHVRAYPDEVGPGGVASETDVLRWFERCRTETLGGAAGLAALQDSGVHVVVARITKGAFVPQLDVLGKELCVRSVVKVVRRGAMVKFTQQLLDPSDATTAAEGRVLASAEVTCASIGADDGAVCALPPAAADALAAATSQA